MLLSSVGFEKSGGRGLTLNVTLLIECAVMCALKVLGERAIKNAAELEQNVDKYKKWIANQD